MYVCVGLIRFFFSVTNVAFFLLRLVLYIFDHSFLFLNFCGGFFEGGFFYFLFHFFLSVHFRVSVEQSRQNAKLLFEFITKENNAYCLVRTTPAAFARSHEQSYKNVFFFFFYFLRIPQYDFWQRYKQQPIWRLPPPAEYISVMYREEMFF